MATVSTGFLPSEVARLVLGYLKEQECCKAAECFLNESVHLDEYRRMLADGFCAPLTIGGRNLNRLLSQSHLANENARLAVKDQLDMWDKLEHIVSQLRSFQSSTSLSAPSIPTAQVTSEPLAAAASSSAPTASISASSELSNGVTRAQNPMQPIAVSTPSFVPVSSVPLSSVTRQTSISVPSVLNSEPDANKVRMIMKNTKRQKEPLPMRIIQTGLHPKTQLVKSTGSTSQPAALSQSEVKILPKESSINHGDTVSSSVTEPVAQPPVGFSDSNNKDLWDWSPYKQQASAKKMNVTSETVEVQNSGDFDINELLNELFPMKDVVQKLVENKPWTQELADSINRDRQHSAEIAEEKIPKILDITKDDPTFTEFHTLLGLQSKRKGKPSKLTLNSTPTKGMQKILPKPVNTAIIPQPPESSSQARGNSSHTTSCTIQMKFKSSFQASNLYEKQDLKGSLRSEKVLPPPPKDPDMHSATVSLVKHNGLEKPQTEPVATVCLPVSSGLDFLTPSKLGDFSLDFLSPSKVNGVFLVLPDGQMAYMPPGSLATADQVGVLQGSAVKFNPVTDPQRTSKNSAKSLCPAILPQPEKLAITQQPTSSSIINVSENSHPPDPPSEEPGVGVPLTPSKDISQLSIEQTTALLFRSPLLKPKFLTPQASTGRSRENKNKRKSLSEPKIPPMAKDESRAVPLLTAQWSPSLQKLVEKVSPCKNGRFRTGHIRTLSFSPKGTLNKSPKTSIRNKEPETKSIKESDLFGVLSSSSSAESATDIKASVHHSDTTPRKPPARPLALRRSPRANTAGARRLVPIAMKGGGKKVQPELKRSPSVTIMSQDDAGRTSSITSITVSQMIPNGVNAVPAALMSPDMLTSSAGENGQLLAASTADIVQALVELASSESPLQTPEKDTQVTQPLIPPSRSSLRKRVLSPVKDQNVKKAKHTSRKVSEKLKKMSVQSMLDLIHKT